MIVEGWQKPLGSLRLSRVGRVAASCALGIRHVNTSFYPAVVPPNHGAWSHKL